MKHPTIHGPAPSCSACAARGLCLPSGADAGDAARFDGLVGYRRRMARGAILFRRGQSFAMIYAVRFGHLKSSRLATPTAATLNAASTCECRAATWAPTWD